MSRVHQALRKAEREGRVDFRQMTPRSIVTEEIRKEMTSAEVFVPRGESCSPVLKSAVCSENVVLPVSQDPKLVALTDPKSFPSEQYRALKTKLYQMRTVRSLRTVLITSAVAAEGKTLTAVNLALTISQEIEQKVLLIDADLRKPSVHKILGLPKTSGLANFLIEEGHPSSVAIATGLPNLWVIPAGAIPENPAELLNTQRMKELLAFVSEQFDWVIIDSPPVVPLADAELISAFVDGILLVVRACQTPAALITKAVGTLKDKNVIGVVLNGLNLPKNSKYSYYYSYGSPKA